MIKIDKLFFRYENSDWLFKDLSFKFGLGRICGLLGKNGVGKTSLLRIIAGLIFPKEGSCRVFDYEPQKREVNFLQQIYFLPEEFYLPEYSAEKYYDLHAPFYPAFNKKMFQDVLHDFDLKFTHDLKSYSYGQKKKFLLAFALATECKVLLLDEPTNGLDIPGKSQFRRIVAGNLTQDKSFIISTHQVRDLESLIDTVVILENGKILFNKTSDEISSRLTFVDAEEPDKNALYQEKIFGGYQIIKENKTKHESAINLESLFSGVLAMPEIINSVFVG